MDNRANIFLSMLLAGLVILCALIARPFLGSAILASLLAAGFYPLHVVLCKWIHKPSLAALLSTLVILLAVLLPLTLLAMTVGGELGEQYRRLTTAAKENGGMAPHLRGTFQGLISSVAPWVNMSEQEIASVITGRLAAAFEWAAQHFVTGLVAVGSWVVNATIASVILFFFLRDGPRIVDAVVDLVPLRRDDSVELIGVINSTVRANFNGVIGVGIVQGGLTGIGLAISGIPSPFTWGLVAGLSSMLPLFGSALVWVPAVVWLLATGSYGTGIFLLVWGIVVSVSDNILRPLVVGGQTNQNGLLVFLSLLGGTAVFGPSGLFLGPLVVSMTVAVLRVFRRKITPPEVSNVLASPRSGSFPYADVELKREL